MFDGFEVFFQASGPDASCEKYIRKMSFTAPVSTEDFLDGKKKKGLLQQLQIFHGKIWRYICTYETELMVQSCNR